MDSSGADLGGLGFDMSPLMNQPPQMFANYNADASPMQYDQMGSAPPEDSNAGNADEMNDAKRRRIARVRWRCDILGTLPDLLVADISLFTGLRHVP
jgi:hypothetical protein